MAHKRIGWKDHVVERPRTYTETINEDQSVTLTPAPGEVIQQGTPLSATNLNAMDAGITGISSALDEMFVTFQAELRAALAMTGGAVAAAGISDYLINFTGSLYFKWHPGYIDDDTGEAVDSTAAETNERYSDFIMLPAGSEIATMRTDELGLYVYSYTAQGVFIEKCAEVDASTPYTTDETMYVRINYNAPETAEDPEDTVTVNVPYKLSQTIQDQYAQLKERVEALETVEPDVVESLLRIGALESGVEATDGTIGMLLDFVSGDYPEKSEGPADMLEIPDAVALPLKALEVDLAPMQDLHGYDNPWPAGGGKNLLSAQPEYTTNTATTCIDFGEDKTFDVVTLSFTANGATYTNGSAGFVNFKKADNTNQYALPGNFTIGGDPTKAMQANVSNTGRYQLTQTSITFRYLIVNYMSSSYATFTNDKLSDFQLESGSTATTYAPYSNICPITGFDSVKVRRTGKNLFAETYAQPIRPGHVTREVTFSRNSGSGYRYHINGTATGGGANWQLTWYDTASNAMPAAPFVGKTLTLSVVGTDKFIIYNGYFDMDGVAHQGNGGTMAVTSAMKGLRYWIQLPQNASIDADFDIQLEISDTTTAFEPYNGEVYEITMPTEAGTVYGGTLDVVAGTLVVDHKYIIADGTNIKATAAYGNSGPKWLPAISISGADTAVANTVIADVLSTQIGASNVQNTENSISNGANNIVLHVGTIQGTDGTYGYNSQDEVKNAVNAYLQDNPIGICYELATPVTYTMTPEQIVMLTGYNALWADKSTVSCVYLAEGDRITPVADQVIRRIIPTTAVEGNPVVINDAAKAPLNSLAVAIEPVQDLHGYDNPWPAGGGKNLLKLSTEDFASTSAVNGLTWSYSASTEKLSVSGTNSKTDEPWLITQRSDAILPTFVAGATYTFSHNLPTGLYAQITYNDINNTRKVLVYLISGGVFNSQVFTVPEDFGSFHRLQIGCAATAGQISASNLVFEVSAGSTAPTAWSPYSNICPITGFSAANVVRSGKNICPYPTHELSPRFLWGSGDNRIIALLNTLPAGTYTMSNKAKILTLPASGAVAHGDYYITASVNGSNVVLLSPTNTTDNSPAVGKIYEESGTFTITEAAAGHITSCGFYIDSSNHSAAQADRGTYNVYDIQIQVGSPATTYEPYNATTYTVSFGSAGTVYGGTLDVVAGTLTVDRVMDTFDGSDDENWELNTTGAQRYCFTGHTSTIYPARDSGIVDRWVNSIKLETSSQNDPNGITCRCAAYRSNNFYVFMPSAYISSVDDFRDFLEETPLQLVYPLETPVTYTLTPTEIRLLLGANILTTNADTMSLTYHKSLASLESRIAAIEAALANA